MAQDPFGFASFADGSAFDALPYPACVVGADTRVVAANSQARQLLDVSREEILGRSLLECIELRPDASSRARVRHACAERVVFTDEVLFRRPRGDSFWNDLILVPWGANDEMLAIFRDVTSRRTAEQALAMHGAGDRLLLDRIPAGIVIHAADTAILYANATATEILGVSHDAALLATADDERWEFVREDGTPMALEDFPVSVVLRTRSDAHGMLVGKRRESDGKRVWAICSGYPIFDATGGISEIVVSFVEVTQLKETELALARSQERLRLVLAGSRDAPWDWDIRTGEIYYSPRYLEMIGLDESAAHAGYELWVRSMPEEDRDRVTAEFGRLLGSTAQTYELEFSMMHAKGHAVRVLSRGFIQRDASGAAVRVSGTNTDITERRELDARLRQSQKLEAIGQLAGGVAHDFNNVLAVILGNLDLVRQDLPANSPFIDSIDDALAAAHRGADLTRRLLAFGRQQAFAEAVVDIGDVVHGVQRMLARLLGETVTLEVQVDAGLPQVWTDAHELENAIVNLSINARDAMPHGGLLRISARAVSVDRVSAESVELTPGRYVCLTLEDNGEGMAPDVAARALDPFFTTKPTGSGTGLGLSMAYGFARQSGGTLRLTSAVGEGTTVQVYLPVLASVERPVATTEESAPTKRHSGAQVLVVEDEEAVRRLCVRTLQSLGIEVLEAGDGQSALKVLASSPRVDLLLSDVVMPNGMSGRELAEHARAKHPGLRVLHMSGYPAQVFDDLAPEDRDRLLRKPFTVAALSRAVSELLDEPRDA